MSIHNVLFDLTFFIEQLIALLAGMLHINSLPIYTSCTRKSQTISYIYYSTDVYPSIWIACSTYLFLLCTLLICLFRSHWRFVLKLQPRHWNFGGLLSERHKCLRVPERFLYDLPHIVQWNLMSVLHFLHLKASPWLYLRQSSLLMFILHFAQHFIQSGDSVNRTTYFDDVSAFCIAAKY